MKYTLASLSYTANQRLCIDSTSRFKCEYDGRRAEMVHRIEPWVVSNASLLEVL